MKPKDRAKELYNRFYKIKMSVSTHLHHKRVKECAIIAVDIIIDNIYSGNETAYWKEVKENLIQL